MSVEVPVQPDLNAMWEAVALPHTDPAYIDPELLILAQNDPRDVKKAIVGAEFTIIRADGTIDSAQFGHDIEVRSQAGNRAYDRSIANLDGAHYEAPEEDGTRVVAAQRKLEDARAAREDVRELEARTALVNRARGHVSRLATTISIIPGAVLGAGLVVGFVEGVTALAEANAAAVAAKNPQPKPSPTPSTRPSLPPDSEGVHYEQGPNGTMIVTTTVTEGQSAAAVNPLARTCEPTGQEAPADKVAAQNALKAVTGLGEDVEITSTEVKGVADDTSGSGPDAGLGIPDKPGTGNDCRGNMRKDVGVQVITVEAAAAGVNLGKVTATGGEHVLQQPEIANVDRIAGQLGISRTQLIAAYNIDRAGVAGRVNADDLKALDGYFFRGVEYKLTLSRTTQETKQAPVVQSPVTDLAEGMKENNIAGISIEYGIAGLVGFLGGALGLFGADKLQGRLARRWAQRQVRRIRSEQQTASR